MKMRTRQAFLTAAFALFTAACGGGAAVSEMDSADDVADSVPDSAVSDETIESSDSGTFVGHPDCLPPSVACEDVECGAARNGCGGYYLCVVEPAPTCGCEERHIHCADGYTGFYCAPPLLPVGCYDFEMDSGLWCCVLF